MVVPYEEGGAISDRPDALGRWTGSGAWLLRQTLNLYYVYPVVLLGLTLLFFRKGSGGGGAGVFLLLLALANGALLLLYAAEFSGPISKRYVSFLTAMILPWAGWGFWRTVCWLFSRRAAVAAAAFAVAFSSASLLRTVDYHRTDRGVLREAAEWLRENRGEGKRIITTHDAVPYHAGGTLVGRLSDEQVLESVSSGGVDFLIFEEERAGQLSQAARGKLRPVHRFGDPPYAVVIYEVRP
ncbi:MAG: hypothetical protein ACYTAF_13385 [Planctomycetota bacterium]|jgi:hypothetical protein